MLLKSCGVIGERLHFTENAFVFFEKWLLKQKIALSEDKEKHCKEKLLEAIILIKRSLFYAIPSRSSYQKRARFTGFTQQLAFSRSLHIYF